MCEMSVLTLEKKQVHVLISKRKNHIISCSFKMKRVFTIIYFENSLPVHFSYSCVSFNFRHWQISHFAISLFSVTERNKYCNEEKMRSVFYVEVAKYV